MRQTIARPRIAAGIIEANPILPVQSLELCAKCRDERSRLNEDYQDARHRLKMSQSRKGDFPPEVWIRVCIGIRRVAGRFTRRCEHYG